MNQNPTDQRKKIITALAGLIVIVIIVAAVIASPKKSSTKTVATTTTPATSSAASTTNSSASQYKDGSYTGKGSYQSPGGTESITITTTLKNGIVTATSAKSGSTSGTSEIYQTDFIDGYKKLVIGKSISSIKLGRISGSSLTSIGFNEAITQIQSEAKA